MTLEITTTKVIRDGDGNATSFAFPFVIFDASDLTVIHIDPNGVETLLDQGIDYSITPAGAYPSVGSITYPIAGSPLPTGQSLLLLRATPKTQDTKLRNQGGYFAEVQEMTFDRVTAMIQEVGEAVDRSVKVPAGSTVDVDLLISTLLQIPATVVSVYDFGFTKPDAPLPDEVLQKVVLARALTIPAHFVGSAGHVDTPPDNSFEIDVTADGVSIGTITISDAGLFSFETEDGTPKSLAAGTAIRFVAPSSDDPSIAGIAVTVFASIDLEA
jgi:hypothetical protein